ncbi:hypothetical protein YZOS03_17310 [Vibrio alginolyticus]|nr:hypothetical protein YZOS03_17310 [Vibrio alginolyticus]BCG17431.1 hypothetical protein HLBS07_12830 [Vibrio alginolyticus]
MTGFRPTDSDNTAIGTRLKERASVEAANNQFTCVSEIVKIWAKVGSIGCSRYKFEKTKKEPSASESVMRLYSGVPKLTMNPA